MMYQLRLASKESSSIFFSSYSLSRSRELFLNERLWFSATLLVSKGMITFWQCSRVRLYFWVSSGLRPAKAQRNWAVKSTSLACSILPIMVPMRQSYNGRGRVIQGSELVVDILAHQAGARVDDATLLPLLDDEPVQELLEVMEKNFVPFLLLFLLEESLVLLLLAWLDSLLLPLFPVELPGQPQVGQAHIPDSAGAGAGVFNSFFPLAAAFALFLVCLLLQGGVLGLFVFVVLLGMVHQVRQGLLEFAGLREHNLKINSRLYPIFLNQEVDILSVADQLLQLRFMLLWFWLRLFLRILLRIGGILVPPIHRPPNLIQGKALFSHLLEKGLRDTKIPEANLSEAQPFFKLLAVSDGVYGFNKLEGLLAKGLLGLPVAHPDQFIVVDLEVVGKAQAVVNRNQLGHFLGLILGDDRVLLYQNIGVVAVAVQYPNIQDGYLVNLLRVELVRTHVACDIVALDEDLQGAVLCFELVLPVELYLQTRCNRLQNLLLLDERGMEKLHKCCLRDSMETLLIQQKGCHLSCCTLATQDSLPYARRARSANVVSRVVLGEGLLVEGFENGDYFLQVVFQKISARSTFVSETGPLAIVQAGLDVHDEVGDGHGSYVEDVVRVYDAQLYIALCVHVLDDDDAVGLDAEIEEPAIVGGELQVLVEQAYVVARQVILKFSLGEQFFELVDADPREQTYLHHFLASDRIVKVDAYLFGFLALPAGIVPTERAQHFLLSLVIKNIINRRKKRPNVFPSDQPISLDPHWVFS